MQQIYHSLIFKYVLCLSNAAPFTVTVFLWCVGNRVIRINGNELKKLGNNNEVRVPDRAETTTAFPWPSGRRFDRKSITDARTRPIAISRALS